MHRAACWLGLWVLSGSALAEEKITRYFADIRVQADTSVVVTERIRVQAEGVQIRRGIFRDFPTRYRDHFGNRYRVAFQVLSVTRNGQNEPWFTENRSNGVRLYIGDANRYVPTGEQEYVIWYRSDRQLGYFEDRDEIYWNVTGNGWSFAIESAGARVALPFDVRPGDLSIALYTGAQGQSGTDARSRIDSGREVSFETTRSLPPNHGLTVAVGWPKGLIEEPGSALKLWWFVRDNQGFLVIVLGLAAVFAWYLRTWHRHGRDPRRGVIIPRFEPPEGISPAASRYVLDMGLRSRSLTAAIVSLAVKGHLRIDDKDGGFMLYRLADGRGAMSEGEAKVLVNLLPEGESWIELDNEHYRVFQSARSELSEALKREHQGRLFRLNTVYMIPAILLSVLTALLGGLLGTGALGWVVFAIGSLALHVTFLVLLRAPTVLGRRIMDEIEGFRMYLDTAEQDRLERMRSPRLTPEVFEMFLPYAFALGVENSWCRRFENELPREVTHYQPAWYSGRQDGIRSLHHVGNRLGDSFSSAISSASTPPGSSSGSGGGGSSGGGGGGGGGGGW